MQHLERNHLIKSTLPICRISDSNLPEFIPQYSHQVIVIEEVRCSFISHQRFIGHHNLRYKISQLVVILNNVSAIVFPAALIPKSTWRWHLYRLLHCGPPQILCETVYSAVLTAWAIYTRRDLAKHKRM